MTTSAERRAQLTTVFREARSCTRCPELARTRRQVVFGSGNADADLMFVGEAPGAREDEQGIPFVGAAGRLLDELLGEVGLARADVFIANVLKCLSHDAPVQLGDGSWAPVGRLVRSRYGGTVMSVGDEGELVRRRVIGWHASPLGSRSVYRLSRPAAGGADGASIELTGDHPVLTDRGWVRVDDLRQGDRVATGQGLSELAFDVVCGSLLGGGALTPGSATLACSHPADWARVKATLLGELGAVVEPLRAVAGGAGPGDVALYVRTRAGGDPSLHALRRELYDGRRFAAPRIARRLGARMLAFWFMDAGRLRARPAGGPSAELAAPACSAGERHTLREGLLRLGIGARAQRDGFELDAEATRRLSALVAPFTPACMRAKLHPEVERAIPFDPSTLVANARKVLYDEVEVRDAGRRASAGTRFFCIDVEGTHNFVTAAGVVHNCRPPGNRDPLPSEIDSCQGYLMRQVELIQPRVVCTLGNFATKLLRGEPVGISRLHGQAEIIAVGRRAVRLFPLFHPAAALYTRSLLDTLRADFARLPALLAMDPPAQPEPVAEPAPAIPEPELAGDPDPSPGGEPPGRQLGLF